MTGDIPFRPATKDDAYDLAYLHNLASGGAVEIMFCDIVPGVGPVELFAEMFAADGPAYTYRNCVVADDGGRIVGKLCAYPAEEEDEAEFDPRIPADRFALLEPIHRLEVPGAWHISAIAVLPEYQGRGLGRRFMALAEQQAREEGFDEIYLHVFEDNLGAIRLYERLGYRTAGRCTLDHPELAHHGDLLLMRCPVR